MLLWITFVTLSFAKKCESMKIGVVTKPSTEPTFSREMFTSNQGTKRTNMWEIFNPQQTQVWGTAFREEIIKETVSERSETSTSYKTSFSGSSEAVTVFEEFAMDRDGLPFVTAYWLGERWKNCAMSMRGTMSMTGTTIWNEFGENYIEDSSNTKISLWRTNLRLSKALAYHVLLCGDIVSCAGTFSVAQGSGRCCSCSCAEDCFAEGSCCLAMYEDVAHVHTALQNSR